MYPERVLLSGSAMNSFKKEERLCSKKLIALLLNNGSSFVLYPFRITYIFTEEPLPYPAQVLITVSRKRFKRAVDRNRIKRLTREAYRKHKSHILYPHLEKERRSLLLMILYVGNEIFTAKELENKLISALNRLTNDNGKTG